MDRGKIMMNYILIGIYLTLSALGMILFKLGTQKEFLVLINSGILNLKISALSIVGLLFYMCSFLMYMFLISKFDMTYIVPVTTGIMYVVTFIFAVILFNEVITMPKIVGSILILLGVVIINFKK